MICRYFAFVHDIKDTIATKHVSITNFNIDTITLMEITMKRKVSPLKKR